MLETTANPDAMLVAGASAAIGVGFVWGIALLRGRRVTQWWTTRIPSPRRRFWIGLLLMTLAIPVLFGAALPALFFPPATAIFTFCAGSCWLLGGKLLFTSFERYRR
jgi:hypothetical protein